LDALFLEGLFSCISLSEFLDLTNNIHGMIVSEKKEAKVK
jgi:hypothetical protein